MKLKKILCAIALPAIIISTASCGGEPELSSSAPPPSSSSSSEVSESKPELSEDEYKSSCMVIDYDNFNLLTDTPEKYKNTSICYSGYISAVELLSDQKRYGMFVNIVDNMIQTSDTNYVFNTKTMYVQCDIDAPEREPSKWDDVTVYGTFLGTKTQNEKVYPLVVCKYVDLKEKEETTEPDNQLQEKYDNLKQEYSNLYDYYRLFTVHIINNMNDGAYSMDDFEDFFKTYEYLDNPSYEKAQQLIAKEKMPSDEASKAIYDEYCNLQNEYKTLFEVYRMLLLDVGTKIGDDGYTMSEYNEYITAYGESIRSVDEVEELVK